jgi:hypothetical protein
VVTLTLQRSALELDDGDAGSALGALWAREAATRVELHDVATRTVPEPVDESAGLMAYLEWWLHRPVDHLAAVASVRDFLAGLDGAPTSAWSEAFVEGFVRGAASIYAEVAPGPDPATAT